MADLNVVTLVGRLTKDAELSKTKNGVSVLTFTLANNQDRKKKDSEEYESVPNYFYLSYFGERAEKIHPYMTKGKCISVEGRLLQHTWTDNNESCRFASDLSQAARKKVPKIQRQKTVRKRKCR